MPFLYTFCIGWLGVTSEGRSKVKAHEWTSGATDSHGSTVSHQKNSCTTVWNFYKRKNTPKWIGIKSALENSCQGLSARWLLGGLFRTVQHIRVEEHPLSGCNERLIFPCPSQNDVHTGIYSLSVVCSLYMQQMSTYMRHSTHPHLYHTWHYLLLLWVSCSNLWMPF